MSMLRAQKGELWLRPSPRVTLFELQRLVSQRALRRTPRLGARDETHPKGYTPGRATMLRILDAHGRQQYSTPVTITELLVRRLGELTPADLAGCEPTLRTWCDVQVVLSFHEGRLIAPTEPVTMVSFTYTI